MAMTSGGSNGQRTVIALLGALLVAASVSCSQSSTPDAPGGGTRSLDERHAASGELDASPKAAPRVRADASGVPRAVPAGAPDGAAQSKTVATILDGSAPEVLRVRARVVDPGKRDVPLCGIFHVVGVVKFSVLAVEKGTFAEPFLYGLQSCPQGGFLTKGSVYRVSLADKKMGTAFDPFEHEPGRRWWITKLEPIP